MKIVIRKGKEPWKVVESEGYTHEGHLRDLMANDPSLIPVAEIESDSVPFDVAITEFRLRGCGSIDVLAFNRYGGIGIVECKLADNPEIRRKVIGQILEYAAYLQKLDYKTLDSAVIQNKGKSLEELVNERAADDDPEWQNPDFQKTVDENLREGNYSLVIAVDEMDDNLRTTIDFINTCGLQKITINALEMNYLSSGDIEILVPHLFGASKPKDVVSSQRRIWNETDFFVQAKEKASPNGYELIKKLFAFTKENNDHISWGTGRNSGSFTFQLNADGKLMSVFNIYTSGNIYISCGDMARKIKDQKVIDDFRKALSQISALKDIDKKAAQNPKYDIGSLMGTKEDFDRFSQAVLGLKKQLQE